MQSMSSSDRPLTASTGAVSRGWATDGPCEVASATTTVEPSSVMDPGVRNLSDGDFFAKF